MSMIKVENLSKRYAGVTAIKNISFEVEKGEIVGFLGPNGAGKSTTMRILSSFMPASSGTASIAGYDVFSESLKARARLGYMPENVPLYTDMRVSEYLLYRGNLKGVHGRRLKQRLGEVLELCSLDDVKKKLIGNLSKGYRQRVGLADALIHNPDLLILDEPTIGLDPTQIRHVRALITDLANHHTILLSTHILSEVEKTCSRVIIINQGNIEASDTPQNLVQTLRSGGGIRLEAKVANENPEEHLEQITGVKGVEVNRDGDWCTMMIRVDAACDLREEVFRVAVDRKWKVRELTRRRATLEDVFVELTQAD